MNRLIVFVFLVVTLFSCGKDEPQEIYVDNTYPVISQQTPIETQFYNKDFPIHLTGSATDNSLKTLSIYVVDSLTDDTIYTFTPQVTGKTGHAYNHQYYNPQDSGYKHVLVIASDSANHVSSDVRRYFVY